MKTTFQEMLDGIKSLDWSMGHYGSIRCENNLCPVVAAAHELARKEFEALNGTWVSGGYNLAADVIGLTINVDDFIVAVDNSEGRIRASHDGQRCGHLIRIRRRVLKALGLTER